MHSGSYSSEGIVLARRTYGEADRILVIFSLESGKLNLIAKGVRRPKSKKRGHIEIFCRLKFTATNGYGIDQMLEAEVIDDFKDVRMSLKKISLAYYFCEVIGKITHEGEKLPEIYNLLLGSLEKLKTTGKLKDLRLDFIVKLLTMLGYWPEGEKLDNPDRKLSEILERDLSSIRVAKRILI